MMNDKNSLQITRITHACVLIDFGRSVVLTDPWFTEKFGYYRGEPLGLRVRELPPLAAMVISHQHFDHNDMPAMAAFYDKEVPVLAEAGAVQAARDAGFSDVRAMAPFGTATVGGVAITAVPGLHGVPEIGFVLQALNFTVYFGGDTKFIPAFSEVAQRFPHIDVALLPINGLRVFGKQVVMDPTEAAEACKILRPRLAIPTHYAFTGGRIMDALFLGYYDKQERLPAIFQNAVAKRAPQTRVLVLRPGSRFDFGNVGARFEWSPFATRTA